MERGLMRRAEQALARRGLTMTEHGRSILERPKPPSRLAAAETKTIWKAKKPHLTDREREVVLGAADGYTNAEIAARLFASEETVKHHLKVITRRLGARNRAHVVAICLREKLIR